MTPAALAYELEVAPAAGEGFYSIPGYGEVAQDEWYEEVGLRSTPDRSVVIEPRLNGAGETAGSHHVLAPGSWMPICPRIVGGRLPSLDEIEGNPE